MQVKFPGVNVLFLANLLTIKHTCIRDDNCMPPMEYIEYQLDEFYDKMI